MQVYRYTLKEPGCHYEFFVTARSEKEAINLLDITESEFKQHTQLCDESLTGKILKQTKGQIVFRNVETRGTLEPLAKGESLLSFRLKHLLTIAAGKTPSSAA